MGRRNLWAGTLVLISSLLLMAGTASAHSTVAPAVEKAEAANCKIITLPGLMRQGEFGNVGSVGDVVTVECNPAVFPGGTVVEISDAQLESRCLGLTGGGEFMHGIIWVNPNMFSSGEPIQEFGNSIDVELDGDGNVNVGLVAGPNCAVGGTVISGHTQPGKGNTTVESFAGGFAVEPAKPSTEGVKVMPKTQVEDEESSSVATLIQAEYGSTEAKVRVAAPELFSRCEVDPTDTVAPPGQAKVIWLRPNFTTEEVGGVTLLRAFGFGKELAGGEALVPGRDEALKTDNDGNAFVIAIGAESCQPGKSYFEADEEEAPFNTEEPSFTILAPEPTPPF
jgi:hypothetical protein